MRRSEVPKARHHIWIENDIWDKLGEHYSDSIGISGAINKILGAFLKSLEAKAELAGRPQKPADLEELESE